MTTNTKLLKQLDITVNEFLLCEVIAQNESHNGFCRLEKKVLARHLEVSEIYIFKMIRDLVSKGLLEKHPSPFRRRFLRVNQQWKEAINNDGTQI